MTCRSLTLIKTHRVKLNMFAAVLLALTCSFVAGISTSRSSNYHCNAVSLEYNRTCEVPYLGTVTLHCLDATSWFRLTNRIVPAVCGGQPSCTLTEVTEWSTGLYFCRTLGRDGKTRDYFVNLIVLAPPALLNVAICTTPEKCRMPQPTVFWGDRQLKISVFYKGTGNFTVSWSKQRDDGTSAPFDCATYFQPNHCKLDALLNQQSITLFNNPFQPDDEGTYVANVTNEFGYNTSSTAIAIRCNAVVPTKPSHVDPQQVNLTQGAVENITCSAEMATSTNLITCYQGQDNTSYCSTCLAYTTGSCSPIIAKPHWTIVSDVSYPLGSCKPQREVRITISGAKADDVGTINCYWLATSAEGRILYATQVIVAEKL